MEQIKNKVYEMKLKLQSKFEKEPIVSLLDYSSLMYKVESNGKTKEVWSKALQKAIDENKRVYIPKGTYYIGESVILPSDRQIIADEEAYISLLKGVKVLLLRNKEVIDGSFCSVGMSAPHNENIWIEGGIWAEEMEVRGGFGETGRFDEEDSMHGVGCCLLLDGIENLVLYNMKFYRTAGFAIQMGRCENFLVEKILYKECFADGVHINGEVKTGLVKDISGYTEDDLVAINVWDWDMSTINNGPLEDLVIENIDASETEYGCKAMRIMTGILPTEKVDIDCYIKNLYVKNTRNVKPFKLYLQTTPYIDKPEGAKVGRIESVYFEDIYFDLNKPTDGLPNFANYDPITGHFGLFEIGCNADLISLKNIQGTIDKNIPTAHLMVVGPRESFFEAFGKEVFDPYIQCEVKKIEYENIIINKEKIDDLNKEIFLTEYDSIYRGMKDGEKGFGKVLSVINKNK